MKFLADMPTKKGGIYGAAGARPGGDMAGGLNSNGVRGNPRYKSDAERQQARRVRRYQAGLNSSGRPYQRHPNFVNPAAGTVEQAEQLRAQRAHKLAVKLARYRRLAKANRAAGLRSDGKPFRRHVVFHAWQQFRSGIAVPTQTFCDAYMTTTEKAYK